MKILCPAGIKSASQLAARLKRARGMEFDKAPENPAKSPGYSVDNLFWMLGSRVADECRRGLDLKRDPQRKRDIVD
jgi:hypothetical protein